jgi:two-component sensor histidine kinase
VQAVANQSLSSHDTLDEARTVFIARLQALALANRHIVNSDWSGVELHELIESELEPFRTSVTVEGNPVTIHAQKVQNFALALHELVTNAAKYGALSIPAGEVQISWAITRASSNTTLHFRWRESRGPHVVALGRQGFGVTLLKGMFPGIRLDYLEEGLDCAFEMPL